MGTYICKNHARHYGTAAVRGTGGGVPVRWLHVLGGQCRHQLFLGLNRVVHPFVVRCIT